MEVSRLAVILSAQTSAFTFRGAAEQLTAFEARLASTGSALTDLLKRTAGIGAGLLGGIGIGTGIKLAAEFEQTSVAITTMVGDATNAKTLLSDLSAFASTTPFEFPELASAGKKLLAFGTSAGGIVPELRMLGDIAAGVGAPIGELAELYGKARVQGRLMAEDVNQFTGRGIPLIQELARQFGVSTSEVRGLVETGRVGFPNLERAFRSLTEQGGKFAGMTEAQSKTLSGLWSTLKDNAGAALRGVSETLLREFNVKDGMRGLIEWAESFGRRAIAIASAVAGWTKEAWALTGSTIKLTASIGAGTFVATKLVAIGARVVDIYKAIRVGQTATLALAGPAGWATLAAGVAIAAGAHHALSLAFDSASDAARKAAADVQSLATANVAAATTASGLTAALDTSGAGRLAAINAKLRELKEREAGGRELLESFQGKMAVARQARDAQGLESSSRSVAVAQRSLVTIREAIANTERYAGTLREAADAQAAHAQAAFKAAQAVSVAQAAAESRSAEIDKSIAAMHEEAPTAGMAADRVQMYRLSVQGATEAQLRSAAAALTWGTAMRESARSREAVRGMIQALREQAETIGMTSHQLELYRLKREGATAADMRQAEALVAAADRMEAQKKALDELGEAAKRIADEVRTPWERMRDELAITERALAEGKLTPDQADRKRRKIAEELGGATSAPKLEAMERRFTAGFVHSGESPQEKRLAEIKQLTERMLDELRAANKKPVAKVANPGA